MLRLFALEECREEKEEERRPFSIGSGMVSRKFHIFRWDEEDDEEGNDEEEKAKTIRKTRKKIKMMKKRRKR